MIWQISIREGMKAAEQRMKELQKLIENGENYLQYKFPVHSKHHRLACFAKNGRKKGAVALRKKCCSLFLISKYPTTQKPDSKEPGFCCKIQLCH